MADPAFPDVPDAPGVPPVNRDASNPVGSLPAPAPLSSDGPGVNGPAQAARWGIYDENSEPVIIADSCVSVDFQKLYDIPRYPMEDGSFQSYNKVEEPYRARIRLTRGGSDGDRSAFLAELQGAVTSLDLISVVTPEMTYLNGNVVGFNYDRTAERGVGLITAEITVEEVRESATSVFSNTKSVSATGQVDTGAVQPRPPTPVQAGAGSGGAS